MHVVIDELAEERRAGRLRGVVRIVEIQRRIGDEQDRALVQRILGIHDAAGLAKLSERGGELRTRRCERRQAEDSPEAIFTNRCRCSLRVRGGARTHHANARRHRAGCTECAEKTAAAHSIGRLLPMHRAAGGRSRFFELLIHWSSHCISPWLMVPGVVRGHAGSSPSGARAHAPACAARRFVTAANRISLLDSFTSPVRKHFVVAPALSAPAVHLDLSRANCARVCSRVHVKKSSDAVVIGKNRKIFGDVARRDANASAIGNKLRKFSAMSRRCRRFVLAVVAVNGPQVALHQRFLADLRENFLVTARLRRCATAATPRS